ncbi:MAG: glycosyltransferase [Prevotella sp.]|nr:glycosyltransferase [Prevotella sp.]
MQNNRPFVSVLLVTRNEKDYIEMSLMSLINQTYPKDKMEIIIADGKSTDGTLDIIERIQNRYNTDSFKISVITNDKLILSAGWNLAIKAAKGEYVTRIDAHATANPDFVEKSVETMLTVEAVCVGGKLTSLSLDGEDNIISKVLSSPFGVGNSSFRVSDVAGYADTAVYGLYRKRVFDEVSYFDETTVRNQDIELHSKIKRAGYKFYFNPAIKSTYYTRTTLKKMIKQAYGNGYWNMILIKKGSAAPSIRHLVPFAFVLFLLFCAIGGFVWWPIWVLGFSIVCLHLILGLFFASKKSNNIIEIISMPWLFMSLHLSYGWGYMAAIFKSVYKE